MNFMANLTEIFAIALVATVAVALPHSPIWFKAGLASHVRYSHRPYRRSGNSTALVAPNRTLCRNSWRMRCVVPACSWLSARSRREA